MVSGRPFDTGSQCVREFKDLGERDEHRHLLIRLMSTVTNDLYNGREAEVIANFNDGYSYSKGKLDASLRELVHRDDRKSVKSVKGPVAVKKEDVELIVKEFDISQTQAEKALSDNGGDLDRTLRALVAS